MTISNASDFFDLRCRLATGTATTVGGRTMILLERAERKRRGETPMDPIRYRASGESRSTRGRGQIGVQNLIYRKEK